MLEDSRQVRGEGRREEEHSDMEREAVGATVSTTTVRLTEVEVDIPEARASKESVVVPSARVWFMDQVPSPAEVVVDKPSKTEAPGVEVPEKVTEVELEIKPSAGDEMDSEVVDVVGVVLEGLSVETAKEVPPPPPPKPGYTRGG